MTTIEQVFKLVGETGIARLTAAFYAQVPCDALLGPLYPPHDLVGAEQRLRDFLVYRFGGPQRYLAERGHPKLRMRHVGFAITPAVRHRWVELMEQALVSAEWPPAAVEPVRRFFAESATFLINAE